MVDEIAQQLPAARQACERHGVRALWLFGSAAAQPNRRGFDTRSSDVDLVVDFISSPERLLADQFFDLLHDLERLFGRRVQLMTDRSITNPILREEVDATKELIYAAARQEAVA